VGGYVEVEESYTDLQPFLDYTPPWGGCGDQGAFEPEFELTNYGWGGVKDAKATYGFGRNPAPDANVVADVGSFERTTKVSALDGLRRLGVNVDRLKRGGFKCSSKAQVPACTTQLLTTGILGRIAANNIIRKEATLLIRTSGRLNYNWTDASGASKTRQSPFAAELPLLTFDTGNAAECGAPAPVERDLKPVKFSLDRKNYRIPLGYRGSLAPRQNRRFALTLSADKSSQHFFKIVLELADGRTIATPKFDFNYFLPNMPPPPEDTPDPPEQNPPGR
jgi:hypothetical protein